MRCQSLGARASRVRAVLVMPMADKRLQSDIYTRDNQLPVNTADEARSRALELRLGGMLTPHNLTVAILQRMSDGGQWMGEGWKAVAVAALAAVDDFNARNSSRVAAFGALDHCDKTLDVQMFDTKSSKTAAMAAILGSDRELDFVVGPALSSVSVHVALTLGVQGIPQVSYWATSAQLDDTATYPLFLRTVPTCDAEAFALCARAP